jgi:predicted dehydrogenase
MAGPLRLGIVGLGNVAVAHLEAYRALTSVRVVAGSDPRDERSALMGQRFGFTSYASYDDMMAREALDAVCVFSTVATHRAAVEAAADRGLHVLCEKPLALTLEDTDAMIARCALRDVKLFYGSSYRYLAPLAQAREIIRQGLLGDVRLLLEFVIGGAGPSAFHDMGLAHYPPGTPGGSGYGLVDHGIHLMDVFPWLVGSPIVAVSGRGQISGAPPVPEYAVMELASGAVGHLIYDDATWPAESAAEGLVTLVPSWDDIATGVALRSEPRWDAAPQSIRVFGTKGSLRIYHYAHALYLRTAEGVNEVPVEGAPMPAHFARQMAAFADCVSRGLPPPVAGDDGRRALAAVLGVYRSMEAGVKTRVDTAPVVQTRVGAHT